MKDAVKRKKGNALCRFPATFVSKRIFDVRRKKCSFIYLFLV